MLLTSDWHLTDADKDEYRWQVFDAINDWLDSEGSDKIVYMLGDLCDKTNFHSARLVNRLVQELQKTMAKDAEWVILRGNHDTPLQGPPFWQFLSFLGEKIGFIDQPIKGRAWWLPHSPNPAKDWGTLALGAAEAIFMHQTVTGVTIHGRVFENEKMPSLPRGIPIWSGDIHHPQKVGAVQYVGAPHQVRFGDDHVCRMVEIDHDYKQQREIILHPPSKRVITVRSTAELEKLDVSKGDQVCVRFTMDAGRVDDWAAEQTKINEWAARTGIKLASTETILEVGKRKESLGQVLLDPLAIFTAYCEKEGIEGDLEAIGREILEDVLVSGEQR